MSGDEEESDKEESDEEESDPSLFYDETCLSKEAFVDLDLPPVFDEEVFDKESMIADLDLPLVFDEEIFDKKSMSADFDPKPELVEEECHVAKFDKEASLGIGDQSAPKFNNIGVVNSGNTAEEHGSAMVMAHIPDDFEAQQYDNEWSTFDQMEEMGMGLGSNPPSFPDGTNVSNNPLVGGSSGQQQSSESSVIPHGKRAKWWRWFSIEERNINGKITTKVVCKFCKATLLNDSSCGVSHIKRHGEKCAKDHAPKDPHQTTLMQNEDGQISTFRYNQKLCEPVLLNTLHLPNYLSRLLNLLISLHVEVTETTQFHKRKKKNPTFLLRVFELI
ncbi:hypothetical protein LWI29_032237 [Acer saccharum]|uniref:BED-type domain-containing protein n=1 Tax=Acer saccharum TaxID=4024 RepID=A0AA39V9Z5_ACESA|nr:hypothetical protein LWI29_032237 [Acer saccharum]